MPELPEMENYKRQLHPFICGQTVTNIEVTRPKTLNVDTEQCTKEVKGTQVVDIEVYQTCTLEPMSALEAVTKEQPNLRTG